MIFKQTKLKGAYIIDIEPVRDERGFFSRSFCQKEFKKHGLNFHNNQCNLSYNEKRGTLRGMHYQITPFAEAKMVSCIRGKIYDVIIDLRSNSDTYCQWIAIELSAENCNMLYIPKGFAHGFQTLCDQTMVYYQISEYHQPKFARGIRWNDSAFNIKWPKINKRIISVKDQEYPNFNKEGK